jgi:hypothetical protein
LNFLSFLGWFPGPSRPFCISIPSFSTLRSFALFRHIDPTCSSEPHDASSSQTAINQQLCTTPQPLYPYAAPPGTLCTSCTSCLEQLVLYSIYLHALLHCMSPSCGQRVDSFLSVYAHAPFMSFLYFFIPCQRLLTCAVTTRSPSAPISLHLTAVAPSYHPHMPHRYNTHTLTCTNSLVSMSSLPRSVTLLPRPPHPFKSSVSYPPSCLMPHHTSYPSLAIPYIVAKPRSALSKAPVVHPRNAHHYIFLTPFPICFFRVRIFCCPFCSLGSERWEWVKMK